MEGSIERLMSGSILRIRRSSELCWVSGTTCVSASLWASGMLAGVVDLEDLGLLGKLAE
jgi:hypothetical protein